MYKLFYGLQLQHCIALHYLKYARALMKFGQELKRGNTFACSHIMGTGDTAEQVAAMDQNTVLLWSCASAEFN